MPKKHLVVDQRFPFSSKGTVKKVTLFAGSTDGTDYRMTKKKKKRKLWMKPLKVAHLLTIGSRFALDH